ncbi:MAG: type II secretion system protein [Candidatus Hydrogenedentes bacterium]|nr:type II secretion system protein [Candidatus Hydrogenedentota bacterium]
MPENETEQHPVHVQSTTLKRASMLVAALVLIGILTSFLLPALTKAREAYRLESCADNLGQLGLACRMYANDHRYAYPHLSRVPGRFFPAWEEVYPEYVNDRYFGNPCIVTCPSDVTVPSEVGAPTSWDEEGLIWDDHSYIYFGHFIADEEEGFAFLEAYEKRVVEAIDSEKLVFDERSGEWLLPELFWEQVIYVGENRGIDNESYLPRLHVYFEINPPDTNSPITPPVPEPYLSAVVMFDRPGNTAADFNHAHGKGNVIFMYGNDEFDTYPSEKFNFSPRFFQEFLETEARIEKLYADFVDAQGK